MSRWAPRRWHPREVFIANLPRITSAAQLRRYVEQLSASPSSTCWSSGTIAATRCLSLILASRVCADA